MEPLIRYPSNIVDTIDWRLSPRLPRRREFMRHLFVVDSLDKQMQNEKELIHLASAGGRGLFCICVESINLKEFMRP